MYTFICIRHEYMDPRTYRCTAERTAFRSISPAFPIFAL